ncbi:acyltransferase [Pseudactinotalea suaedae]|uniref:acyltransferase n=1 Tax=Pseudactinotalea suaedae TaxID=1524924 RepID=UPI0012E2E07B|nr:acyltransferase [Pseudactinotalea suaedae]
MPRTDVSATAWLSWLRALAIVAVMVVHTTASTAAAPDARSHPTGVVALLLDFGSHFAVPVFVMVSGALNLDPARYRGSREFLRRRALRLVPAIVFWHAWYVGVRALRGEELVASDVVRRIVVGDLYTQLYFFWIVLGLSLVTPVLMPLIRRWGRTGTGVCGGVALLGTALLAGTSLLSEHLENAALWWVPYLGYYLLGWALREVRVRGGALVAVGAATVALGALAAWQWENEAAPLWLHSAAPVSYYGAGMALYSIGVFLLAHGLLAPDGALRSLLRPPAMTIGNEVGGATMGIFGFHMSVIAVLEATAWLGGNEPAPDLATLFLRLLVVVAATLAVVLPLRRVPVVRRVL